MRAPVFPNRFSAFQLYVAEWANTNAIAAGSAAVGCIKLFCVDEKAIEGDVDYAAAELVNQSDFRP